MLSNDIPVYVTVNSWETKKKQKQRKTNKHKKIDGKIFPYGRGMEYILRVFFSCHDSCSFTQSLTSEMFISVLVHSNAFMKKLIEAEMPLRHASTEQKNDSYRYKFSAPLFHDLCGKTRK